MILACGKLQALVTSSGAGRWSREIHRSGPDPQFDRVSPGLTPRPSLCGPDPGLARGRGDTVSPGLTPRPSLCVRVVPVTEFYSPGFAGAHTPAFVVRKMRRDASTTRREFRRGSHPGLRCAMDSDQAWGFCQEFRRGSHPGLRCARDRPARVAKRSSFRRGSHPGLRCATEPHARQAHWGGRFRRGSHPGLRCAREQLAGAFVGITGFAGAHTPAFVVRGCATATTSSFRGVSPGLTPRPSLCAC